MERSIHTGNAVKQCQLSSKLAITQIRKSMLDIEKEIKDLESGGGDKKGAYTKLETLVGEKKELVFA